MLQSKVIAATKLPGVADLPRCAKLHFAKALIAEQEEEYLIAEFELNRAVGEEAATEVQDGNILDKTEEGIL
jgi:hypothetical protein